MSQVEIRRTSPTDAEALANVLVRVHAKDGYPVEGVATPQAWVELNAPIGQWTALNGGEAVGHVALLRPQPGDGAPAVLTQQTGTPMDRIAVLARLFVDPEARGRGIAQRLLDVAENAARQRALVLVLDVMRKDEAAIRLYEHRGWRVLGRIEHSHGESQVAPGVAYVLDGHSPERPAQEPGKSNQ